MTPWTDMGAAHHLRAAPLFLQVAGEQVKQV